ncbi:hypothetical protein EYF80_003171 [Liparis tanakae]|uniref:Uncharacterized protein n=1 Tax=Liparis tanakae TaxID=230148 RepID=A0A4Z2J911_9TELE|nr:hypothetical protein EYF80_003171 [Liparis tanakae]
MRVSQLSVRRHVSKANLRLPACTAGQNKNCQKFTIRLSALLLLLELKAGNLQDVEEAVAHHAGNGIIHPEKALSKPGWCKNNKRRSKSCIDDVNVRLILLYLHFDIWVRVAIGIHGSQVDTAYNTHEETVLLGAPGEVAVGQEERRRQRAASGPLLLQEVLSALEELHQRSKPLHLLPLDLQPHSIICDYK